MKRVIFNFKIILLPFMILFFQCKKEPVDVNKDICVDSRLLTDAAWYPDKNYDWTWVRFYNDDNGRKVIGHSFNEMYPTVWKLDCNKLLFKNSRTGPPNSCPDGFCDEGKKIITLTKSDFQYDDNGVITLYNSFGNQNGHISIKSDLGNYNLSGIIGQDLGVNSICKFSSRFYIKLFRVNDIFSQKSITIIIGDTDIENLIYPNKVATSNFSVRAGGDQYRSDSITSHLTLTEFKNDTLKGTFSAKMNINRQWYTPPTDPEIFTISEGTFAMKIYRNF